MSMMLLILGILAVLIFELVWVLGGFYLWNKGKCPDFMWEDLDSPIGTGHYSNKGTD